MGGALWKTLPGIKHEISVVCINKDLWMHAEKPSFQTRSTKTSQRFIQILPEPMSRKIPPANSEQNGTVLFSSEETKVK